MLMSYILGECADRRCRKEAHLEFVCTADQEVRVEPREVGRLVLLACTAQQGFFGLKSFDGRWQGLIVRAFT
jgi:hypothetical protein